MLLAALDVAVPAWAMSMYGKRPDELAAQAARDAEHLAAEVILLRAASSSAVTPAGFTALARSIALLALAPGGTDLFGRHWEFR